MGKAKHSKSSSTPRKVAPISKGGARISIAAKAKQRVGDGVRGSLKTPPSIKNESERTIRGYTHLPGKLICVPPGS